MGLYIGDLIFGSSQGSGELERLEPAQSPSCKQAAALSHMEVF